MFLWTAMTTTKTFCELLFKKLWNLSKINKHIEKMVLGFYIKSIKLAVSMKSRAHSNKHDPHAASRMFFLKKHQIAFIFWTSSIVED